MCKSVPRRFYNTISKYISHPFYHINGLASGITFCNRVFRGRRRTVAILRVFVCGGLQIVTMGERTQRIRVRFSCGGKRQTLTKAVTVAVCFVWIMYIFGVDEFVVHFATFLTIENFTETIKLLN